jgi:hypothetical protein
MASNYLSSTGSVDFLSEMSSGASSSSSGWYDLAEDKTLSIDFNKNLFWANWTWSLEIKFDNPSSSSYLWVDINGGKKDIPSYSFDNWMIIDDTSLWTSTQRTSYKTQQLGYLQNGQYWSWASFVSWWLAQLNNAGSFMIFDLWKRVYLNSFDFSFTENVATATPKLIALTFDNWARYNFSVDTSKPTQTLSFMDTQTRFVKLDIIATNDWEGSLSNTVLSWVPNILWTDITIVNWADQIAVTFPSMASANIKYYNIYFASWSTTPTAPALIIPQKAGVINVYYNNTSSGTMIPNNLWIEPCVMDWICKDKINKTF